MKQVINISECSEKICGNGSEKTTGRLLRLIHKCLQSLAILGPEDLSKIK